MGGYPSILAVSSYLRTPIHDLEVAYGSLFADQERVVGATYVLAATFVVTFSNYLHALNRSIHKRVTAYCNIRLKLIHISNNFAIESR